MVAVISPHFPVAGVYFNAYTGQPRDLVTAAATRTAIDPVPIF